MRMAIIAHIYAIDAAMHHQCDRNNPPRRNRRILGTDIGDFAFYKGQDFHQDMAITKYNLRRRLRWMAAAGAC
jgi:hypothetical protein